MPHKWSSDKNKWLLNLDLKLRMNLQIKMTSEESCPQSTDNNLMSSKLFQFILWAIQ